MTHTIGAANLQGISFGILSSVMTLLPFQLGVVLSGNRNVHEIVASIVAMSVADSMADAYGIYFSEEASKTKLQNKGAVRAALVTFGTKILLQLSFVLPFFLLRGIQSPLIANTVWGLSAITVAAYVVARRNKVPIAPYILKTLGFTLCITVGSYTLTEWIARYQ